MLKSAVRLSLLAAAFLFLAKPGFAQVEITGVVANGSGCPRGSVDVLKLGDQASILFSRYTLSTNSRAAIQTRSCNVAVGLRLEPGVAVTLTQIQWMGTMTLARGSVGIFQRDLRFANQSGVTKRDVFRSGFNPIDPIDVLGGVTISGCNNRTAIARANTSLTIMGQGAGEIQSADIATFSRILLDLSVRSVRCRGGFDDFGF